MTATKIKVAHIADCHLRMYQYGSARRGRAFMEGVINAINEAHAAGAAFIVCSGDFLDSNNPGPVVMMHHVRAIHEHLKELEMPMLVSGGNHDNCEPSWLTPYELTSDKYIEPGINFLRPDEVNGGEYNYLDYSLPYPITIGVSSYKPAAIMREELAGYKDYHIKFDIYMWHGEIREFCGYPKEDAICIDDFPHNMASVIAMGDQHIHKYIRRNSDNMVIAYPGSTEMCSESEDDEKKLFIYEFEATDSGNQLVDIRSIPIGTQGVLRRTIRTEEELENTIQDIKDNPDVLAYIRYDRTLHDAVPRLRDAADPEVSCLRLTPMMPDRFNVHTMSREAVKYGPVEFFETNKEDLIHDPEVRQRVEELCKDLLTTTKDHRTVITKYCNDRLETTCL